MRYKIISEQDTEKLEEAVQALLDQGWEIRGGLTYDGAGTFYQVVTNPKFVLTSSEQTDIDERMNHIQSILAIPDDQLSEQQKADRQRLTETLAEVFASVEERANAVRSKNESD